ncbi:MAG: hypothetical protein CMP10_14805 [Zetaproteobacteria bacterium]|nr:hypothetical protein [Pseudobdellovibrionaceae bacterium]
MPKMVDHGAMRQKIIEGSLDLFAASGFTGVSMRNLAKDIGVTTGSLYHYFPNKENLFQQMLEYFVTMDVDTFKEMVAKETSPRTKIEILFQFIEERQDYFLKVVYLIIDFYRLKLTGQIKESEQQIDQLFQTSLTNYIDAVQEQIKLPVTNLARDMIAYFAGRLMLAPLQDKKLNMDQFKKRTLFLLDLAQNPAVAKILSQQSQLS